MSGPDSRNSRTGDEYLATRGPTPPSVGHLHLLHVDALLRSAPGPDTTQDPHGEVEEEVVIAQGQGALDTQLVEEEQSRVFRSVEKMYRVSKG